MILMKYEPLYEAGDSQISKGSKLAINSKCLLSKYSHPPCNRS